jgi:UDP:flavonoid glycosyltransferase YjiC (YdhE family)
VESSLRIFFSTSSYLAHFHPLVPLASAARDAGHEVAFACSVSFAGQVRTAGFTVIGSGVDHNHDPRLRLIRNRMSTTRSAQQRLKLFIIDELVDAMTRLRAPELIEVCESWNPDIIVREQFEFASVMAAEYVYAWTGTWCRAS